MAFDLTPPKVTKGTLANMRTGASYPFTLNPNNIKSPFGANMSEDPIPGFSDPLLRFASGKTKTIKFKLQLSGEMRLRLYGRQFNNGLDGATGLGDYNIKGELDFLTSMAAPTDPTQGDGGLDRFVFGFGGRYPNVVVFVDQVDVDENRWDSFLNITGADVDLTLKRVQDQTVYASQIWTP